MKYFFIFYSIYSNKEVRNALAAPGARSVPANKTWMRLFIQYIIEESWYFRNDINEIPKLSERIDKLTNDIKYLRNENNRLNDCLCEKSNMISKNLYEISSLNNIIEAKDLAIIKLRTKKNHIFKTI